MHSKNTETQARQWWRWPLLPFVSFFGAVLGVIAIYFISWIGMKFHGGYSEDGWYYRYVMPFLMFGLFGGLFSWIACAFAPTARIIAGAVLTTALLLFGLLGVIGTWLSPQYSFGQGVLMTIALISAGVGCGIGLSAAHQEYGERPPPPSYPDEDMPRA